MTLKQFRENIWLQLTLLLIISAICGLVLGLTWFFTRKNQNDQSIYSKIYGSQFTYTLDDNFAGLSDTLHKNDHAGTVEALEKVTVSDGAKIVKVVANSVYFDLEMYVVTKAESAEFIYFTKIAGRVYLKDEYNVKDNVLNLKEGFVENSRATWTYEALTTAIRLSLEA